MKRIEPDDDDDDVVAVTLSEDIVFVIFVHAYGLRLRSLAEYRELMTMQNVSTYFRRVIQRRVIPSVQQLAGEIMAVIETPALALFTGLEFFLCFPKSHYPVETCSLFTRVRSLTLCRLKLPRDFNPLAGMSQLERLVVTRVDRLVDSFVQPLTTLRSLEISHCDDLTEACMWPLLRLESLLLDSQSSVRDVNFLSSLTRLHCKNLPNLTDAGVEKLQALRDLLIDKCPRLTENCLVELAPSLERLDLADTPIRQLRFGSYGREIHFHTLQSLAIGYICSVQLDEVLRFVSSLTALIVSHCTLETDNIHFFASFGKLRKLNIAYAMNGTQFDHMTLPLGLTELTCGGGDVIFNPRLLPLLTELRVLTIKGEQEDLREASILPQLTLIEELRLYSYSFLMPVITDVELAQMTNLRRLVLHNNHTLTYRALAKLTQLTSLEAMNTDITRGEVEALRDCLPRLVFVNKYEQLITPIHSLFF